MKLQWKKCENELPKGEAGLFVWCLVYCMKSGLVIRPYNIDHECWDDTNADDYYCDAVRGSILEWVSLKDLTNLIERAE